MMTGFEFYGRGRACCIALVGVIGMAIAGCAVSANVDDNALARSPLSYLSTINGAWLKPRLNLPGAAPAPAAGFFQWRFPTAVAARGPILYIGDAGHRQLLRYDANSQSVAPFADYASGALGNITIGPDLSVYVADMRSRSVLHFSVEGRLLRSFANEFELARPVAVVLDEATGQIFVADSLYNHVVVFNSLGRFLAVLRSDEGRSLEAMARGPDGLYLVDRVGRKIVVLGPQGTDRYIFGEDTLKFPAAIAVDRFNRVYVSDNFDNTIKIFEREQLVASLSGGAPPRFNQITSLAIDQDLLYVADGVNTRLQTFRIAPPPEDERVHE